MKIGQGKQYCCIQWNVSFILDTADISQMDTLYSMLQIIIEYILLQETAILVARLLFCIKLNFKSPQKYIIKFDKSYI